MATAYLQQPFPLPADDELDPRFREQLRACFAELPVELPLGVTAVFLSAGSSSTGSGGVRTPNG